MDLSRERYYSKPFKFPSYTLISPPLQASGSPPPKEAPASYRETLQSVKAALQATSPGLKPKELDKMARSVVAAQKKQEQAEKERLDSELLASVCIHAFTLIL